MHVHWSHFIHGADIGIRGHGSTLAEAFAQAALALTAVITDLENISPDTEIEITCQADDPEVLFVDWLNAIIYEMATRQMLFSEYDVSIDQSTLHARCRGEAINVAKHQPVVEIKGATYTELAVSHNDANWIAQTIVDV